MPAGNSKYQAGASAVLADLFSAASLLCKPTIWNDAELSHVLYLMSFISLRTYDLEYTSHARPTWVCREGSNGGSGRLLSVGSAHPPSAGRLSRGVSGCCDSRVPSPGPLAAVVVAAATAPATVSAVAQPALLSAADSF